MQRLVVFGVRPASSNLRIRTIPLHSTPSFVRASSGGEKKPYRVEVTRDKVEVKFVRSSGPGGQNVNKLSTKAEVRFHVDAAWWLPEEARARFSAQQATRINKLGEYVVQSDAQRTQQRNLRDCLAKAQSAVDAALVEPKERQSWVEGQGEESKKRRRRAKDKRSEIKAARKTGRGGRDDW
jgi:peptidyl-tRNA hydrolase ICT1